MGNYSEEDKIPAESFMGTISVNVDNEKLSDKMFREMIRNTLPIVEFPREEEKEKKMKTHVVIDIVYHEDEGNEALVGTLDECHQFVKEQGFGFEVKPLTEEEIKFHNQ